MTRIGRLFDCLKRDGRKGLIAYLTAGDPSLDRTPALVEALRKAILTQDKETLETLAAEQLSYSHSDARLEDKAKFINSIMTRKAVVKSIDFPDLTVAIVGNNAIVRHLWVSESELDGKITNTKIGVLQVWQKQDSRWKLLARASFRLPQSA